MLRSLEGSEMCIRDRYFNLDRHIIYRLNKSQPLKCYSSDSGNICIFRIPKTGVSQLNAITYHLIKQANIHNGHVHYFCESNDDDHRSSFFAYDRKTRIFNRSKQPIMKTDFINTFHGRVALAIKGICVAGDLHICLNPVVYQVKVEQEDDIGEIASNECIF